MKKAGLTDTLLSLHFNLQLSSAVPGRRYNCQNRISAGGGCLKEQKILLSTKHKRVFRAATQKSVHQRIQQELHQRRRTSRLPSLPEKQKNKKTTPATTTRREDTHVVAELLRPLLQGLVLLSRQPLGLDHRAQGDRIEHAVHPPSLPGHLFPHRVRLLNAVLKNDFFSQLETTDRTGQDRTRESGEDSRLFVRRLEPIHGGNTAAAGTYTSYSTSMNDRQQLHRTLYTPLL